MKATRFRRALVTVVVIAAASELLGARSALAEPTAEQRAAAETLFREGRELVEKQELAAACDRFEKSQSLDPQIGTLLYVATCHEQLGQMATAWVEFTDALSQAERAHKNDRIEQARQGVQRTEAALSKLTISLKEPAPGVRVLVNDREVATLDAALPYNPGPVTIRVEAPGFEPRTETVQIQKGPSLATVVIPPLEKRRERRPPPDEGKRDHTVAYAVGGAGLGLVALGLAFGGAAWATRDAADEHCEGAVCTEEGLSGHDRANAFAWTSNITIGIGLAAVATGTVLFFVWPAKRAPARPALVLGPGVAYAGWSLPW